MSTGNRVYGQPGKVSSILRRRQTQQRSRMEEHHSECNFNAARNVTSNFLLCSTFYRGNSWWINRKNNKERTMLKWIVFLLCCCCFQLLAVNMLHSGCMLICTVCTVTNLKPSSRSSCLTPVFPVKVNTRLWTSSGDREVQLPGTDFDDWCMPVGLHINTYTV